MGQAETVKQLRSKLSDVEAALKERMIKPEVLQQQVAQLEKRNEKLRQQSKFLKAFVQEDTHNEELKEENRRLTTEHAGYSSKAKQILRDADSDETRFLQHAYKLKSQLNFSEKLLSDKRKRFERLRADGWRQ